LDLRTLMERDDMDDADHLEGETMISP
jgi:hypothetical protein